ncbi:MAG: WbqC family protein [Mangrovibacterium sp.]
MQAVCEYLGIDKKITVFSQMNLKIDPVNAPDEWALNICSALGNINEYWNPPGGKNFFDREKYNKANIKLTFHSINLTEYRQKGAVFEPGLSIIDVMMYNGPEEINRMLDNYGLD